jgi:hypothetical protein
MAIEDFRPLEDVEIKVLEKLLSEAPSDIGFLRAQIDNARVRVVDEYGSLQFFIPSESSDKDRPLVIGRQPDHDTVPVQGPYINLILFLRGDRISELQIFKDDGTPIRARIDPGKFEVMSEIHPKRGGQ